LDQTERVKRVSVTERTVTMVRRGGPWNRGRADVELLLLFLLLHIGRVITVE
jgi:hypothetical protein